MRGDDGAMGTRDAMGDDRALIREFAATRSPDAFAALVRRHVDWIHAAARRQVGASDAADLTQAVFVVLAQKASQAARQPALSPWLFGVLRFAALRCVRDASRRRRHERAAAAAAGERERARAHAEARMDAESAAERERMLALLDACVARLRERDRRPVVMRFYERSSFAQIGRALGVSEEAARKRVTRGVERLRVMFASRGVTTASGETIQMLAMTPALLHAAPPTLAAQAAQAAQVAMSEGAAGAAGATGTLAKGAMAMMRIQQVRRVATALVAVATVAGVSGAAVRAVGDVPPPTAATATASFPVAGDASKVNLIQSDHTMIAVSRDGRRVTGYSKHEGKWIPLALGAEAQQRLDRGAKLEPIVAQQVAALRLGTRVYAYSPLKGAWAELEVADKPGADPTVWTDHVVVNYDDSLHVFSAASGKWAAVDFGK